VAKAELGTKRVCPVTGRKFYDLNKDPVISPYTGEIVPIAPLPTSRSRSAAAAVAPVVPLAPEVEAPETAEVELVSLEDADAEAEGGKKEASIEGEDEVEVAEDAAEDNTFLETDEDEGDDVSDIVGGGGEDEEDT
jgi:uncharacterized protein (TIGR02300 family)